MPGKGIQGEAGLEELLHVTPRLEVTSLTWTGYVLTDLPKHSGNQGASALLGWTDWQKGPKAHLHPWGREGPFLAVQQLCGLKQAQVLLVCTGSLSVSITNLDLDQLHSYLLSGLLVWLRTSSLCSSSPSFFHLTSSPKLTKPSSSQARSSFLPFSLNETR